MWGSKTLFFFISFILLIKQSSAKPKYAAYIPKTLRGGMDFQFSVLVSDVESAVTIKSRFFSTDKSISFTKSSVIQPGKTELIRVGTLPYNCNGKKFRLKLKGVDENERIIFEDSTNDFVFSHTANSLLIQTDKPIYQPGQTVKFRLLCLSPETKPLNHTLTYKIFNSNKDMIMIKNHQIPVKGVVSSELELHSEAKKGFWMLTVKDEITLTENKVLFKVEEYHLPKFEIKIQHPSFMIVNPETRKENRKFEIKVTAKYTFGKPVRGKLKIIVYALRLLDKLELEQNEQNFNGEATFVFFPSSFSSDFTRGMILVDFIEQHTSEARIEYGSFRIIKENIKVKKLPSQICAKPGFDYRAYLQVTEYDGSPLLDIVREKLQVSVKVDYSNHMCRRDSIRPTQDYNYLIPANGIVEINFNVSRGFSSTIQIDSQLIGSIENYDQHWSLCLAQSSSNSFIDVRSVSSKATLGSNSNFFIRTTEYVKLITITVVNHGSIIFTDTISSIEAKDHFEYSLAITEDMKPTLMFIASYIRPDGELIADFSAFAVSSSLTNKFEIQTSSSLLDAGQDISITVQASDEDSFIGLKAIDKSVLLLKNGNDITEDLIQYEMKRYTDHRMYSPLVFDFSSLPVLSPSKTSEKVFEIADLIVVSSAWMLKDCSIPVYVDSSISETASLTYRVDEPALNIDYEDGNTRSNFPETWLWIDSINNNEGKVTYNLTVPDTITSWVLSAFAISDQSGLSIADTTMVTVFREFFININLPLTITRGEVVIVQVIVYNYFPNSIEASLKLYENENFELIIPGDDLKNAGATRTISIPPNDSYSVSYPIRLTSIGDVDIIVEALSELAFDRLKRTVLVKPEGISHCYSKSEMFSLEVGTPERSLLKLQTPQNVVEGSISAQLFIYGDVLGNTMNNLGSLIREPTGCGEQNMINFAPGIFVTLYLEKIQRLKQQLKKTAYKNFIKGFQNELNFKHSDGSYSAFGERDPHGSLWLTAFVLKCFKHATLLEDGVAEQLEDHIRDAETFIFKSYESNGLFMDRGKVIHQSLQSGVRKGLTMSAYIAISLLESNNQLRFDQNQSLILDKVRRLLEDNLDYITNKPYQLSMVTYALHLLGSSRMDEAFDSLMSLAINNGAHMYWSDNNEFVDYSTDQIAICDFFPPPIEIETTSYALLSILLRNETGRVSSIVKWLASQQNPFGGYSNTQDTVIAIQALSSAAGLLHGNTNLTISSNQNGLTNRFYLNEDNKEKLHRLELDTTDGLIEVIGRGEGVAVVQLSVCYNIDESLTRYSPFNCSFESTSGGVDDAEIQLCCSLNANETEPTGMLLYEIGLPNGFQFIDNFIIPENLMKKEVKDQNINLYFYKLKLNDKVCSKVQLRRHQQVAEAKASVIRVADYYQPERSLQMKYSLSELEHLTVCEVCKGNCVGCPVKVQSKVVKDCTDVCEQQMQKSEPECYDVTTNTKIDIGRCSLTNFTEYTTCNNPILPICPDGNLLRLIRHNDIISFSNCSYKGDWVGNYLDVKGIPTMPINLVTVPVSCSNVLEGSQNGFTISLLVHLNSINKTTVQLLSIGKENKKPKIVFKIINTIGKVILNFNGAQHRIYRIKTREWLNKWINLIITWSPNGSAVYVNGVSVGRLAVKKSRRKRSESDSNLILKFGPSRKDSGINGSVTSLLVWKQALYSDEVEQTFEFFKDFLEAANDDNSQVVLEAHMISFLTNLLELDNEEFKAPKTLQEINRWGSPIYISA